MKADELSNGTEAPGEAGGDREWRVAAANFTLRRQAHAPLHNASDAKCPCGNAELDLELGFLRWAGRKSNSGPRGGRAALRMKKL